MVKIYGEHPEKVPNPSKCRAFRESYPVLFAPLQTKAFDRVRTGRNLALIAPTSSGKTLGIAGPLFELRQKAVFVYPFRALVLDQTNQLVRYGRCFGLTRNDFAQVMGGTPERELAKAVEKDYILMTPDKLVSLFLGGRIPKGAALNILSSYSFVFDEIHAYNTLMLSSLIYFIRSANYWLKAVNNRLPAFYFLSATFPKSLWTILKEELAMKDDDLIDGVSNTGDVALIIHPSKNDGGVIARDMQELGMIKNVVCIFNTAIKAWRVAEKLWGREIARKRLFVGQDKISESQRLDNYEQFNINPASGGLVGSPAIEAGVDFGAEYLVIDETYADSFAQRFGRAARSGHPATVLCYSNHLYRLLQGGRMKKEYERKSFLKYIDRIMPSREPQRLLTGLAAFPYYKFWNDPTFITGKVGEICKQLSNNGIDSLLAFRGFIPYTHYQTGESISYKALFKKNLPIQNGKVVGTPTLERYFFAQRRPPVLGILKRFGFCEKTDDHTTIFLVEVDFKGFGCHWTVLEYKSKEYENLHPREEDDNFCLRGLPSGEIGRLSSTGVRNGILRFYEIDA